MSKPNEDFSDDAKGILAGLAEVVEIMSGRAEPARVHVPPTIDVRGIRKRLGCTQAAFADRYGFSRGAVRDWEQGRKTPEPTARVLLTVIEREPEAVERALAL